MTKYNISVKIIIIFYSKEKNPAPLNNLDILLKKSYDDIIDTANGLEKTQIMLKDCSHRLSVILYLIHFLLKIRFNISRETYKLMMNTISPVICNDE